MTERSPALFREFLRHPLQVATATASSDALIAAVADPLPLDGAPTVVELGAGSGRLTALLARRLGGRGRQVAIELNPTLAGALADRHPGVTVVCADAGRLPEILAEHGIGRVDALPSLLPWVAYANAPIPALAAAALAPAGVSTQVSLLGTHLLPPAQRQERDLRAAFGAVTVSAPVWRNLPPARVLVARPAG